MRITVKLFAYLARYLPQGSAGNEARIEVEDGVAVADLLARLRVPAECSHLVLVNGVYVEPANRPGMKLRAGDEVAVWPQVAGG